MIRGRYHSLAIEPDSGQFSAHNIGECTLGMGQLPRGIMVRTCLRSGRLV